MEGQAVALRLEIPSVGSLQPIQIHRRGFAERQTDLATLWQREAVMLRLLTKFCDDFLSLGSCSEPEHLI